MSERPYGRCNGNWSQAASTLSHPSCVAGISRLPFSGDYAVRQVAPRFSCRGSRWPLRTPGGKRAEFSRRHPNPAMPKCARPASARACPRCAFSERLSCSPPRLFPGVWSLLPLCRVSNLSEVGRV